MTALAGAESVQDAVTGVAPVLYRHHGDGAQRATAAIDEDHTGDEQAQKAAARGRQEQLKHEQQPRDEPQPPACRNRRLRGEDEGQRDDQHEDRREVVRLVQADAKPLVGGRSR